MNHWLLKSEPAAWSWDMQMAAGPEGETWDGVRNHQARGLIERMAPGDLALFYHSQSARACVGVVEVIAGPFADPTDATGTWRAVRVAARAPLPRHVTLSAIRARPELSEMALVRQPRLSVQEVTPEAWATICAMGGLDPETLEPA